jgi:hypothetical protein
MTTGSTTRRLMCVLLVVCLCLQVLAIAAPARDRNASAEFRAVAPSSAILLTRGSSGHDHARDRLSAPSLFTVIPQRCGDSDPGRLAAAVERQGPRSLWTAGPRTGRSPPVIS